MLYTIHNEKISLSVAALGAEMQSLRTADGTEYLWQGDSQYWGDRAPNLFPFIGRLTNESYQYLGKVYPMGIHGFAAAKEFTQVQQSENRLVLELREDDETQQSYPFAFSLRIVYELAGETVKVTFRVENRDEKILPFGIGGHPGFRVPLAEGEKFEDYCLAFSTPCQPDRVGFTTKLYLSGHDERYPLRDGRFIDLRHDLFDEDAIILKNMSREVTLRSNGSGRGVRVAYPDMPYLGIWHWPNSDAPYVCIEPWSSLPARQDVVEEFSCKSDMIQLAPGGIYETTWTVTVLE